MTNPFMKPPSDLQVLAGHVQTAIRLLAARAGCTPGQRPPDEQEFLAALVDRIIAVMRQDEDLATLAAGAVYLDARRSPGRYGPMARLPEHAAELATLAEGTCLLLHLHLHGSPEAAVRRPISVDTVQQALALADYQRQRLSPPPKPPTPPEASAPAGPAAHLPTVPAGAGSKLRAHGDGKVAMTVPPSAEPALNAAHPPPVDAAGPDSGNPAAGEPAGSPEDGSVSETAACIVDEGLADEPPAAHADADAGTPPPPDEPPSAARRLRAIADRHHAAHPDQPLTLRVLQRNHGIDPVTVRALAAAHPRLLAVVVRPVGSQGGRPSEVLQALNP